MEHEREAHEALFLALSYLPVYELLVISQVCTSLRDAVKNDVIPWLSIMVGKTLNRRLDNQHLLNLTSKANCHLKALALFNCARITDDGLLQVVAANPFINQLWLPACTSLNPSAVIEAVKLLNQNNHKLKSLRIGGIHSITKEDLIILHHLVDDENQNQSRQKRKLILHRNYHNFSIFQHDDGPAIDVSICPICNEVKPVFDCPRESCKGCKGCKFCIPRCEECGLCIKGEEDDDPAEAACEDSLCLGCWLQLPKCSFCNKPYCSQHADQLHSLSGSSGFVCSNCQARFIDNTDSYED